MDATTYATLKTERERARDLLHKLNAKIDAVNCESHFEPLTYMQFSKAIEFWYDAYNHEHGYFHHAYATIAWSVWKERYDEFIATGSCSHLYTKYVMQGMSYEEAFIRDNNEDPWWSLGGFRYCRPQITEIVYNR